MIQAEALWTKEHFQGRFLLWNLTKHQTVYEYLTWHLDFWRIRNKKPNKTNSNERGTEWLESAHSMMPDGDEACLWNLLQQIHNRILPWCFVQCRLAQCAALKHGCHLLWKMLHSVASSKVQMHDFTFMLFIQLLTPQGWMHCCFISVGVIWIKAESLNPPNKAARSQGEERLCCQRKGNFSFWASCKKMNLRGSPESLYFVLFLHPCDLYITEKSQTNAPSVIKAISRPSLQSLVPLNHTHLFIRVIYGQLEYGLQME